MKDTFEVLIQVRINYAQGGSDRQRTDQLAEGLTEQQAYELVRRVQDQARLCVSSWPNTWAKS